MADTTEVNLVRRIEGLYCKDSHQWGSPIRLRIEGYRLIISSIDHLNGDFHLIVSLAEFKDSIKELECFANNKENHDT